MSGAVPFAEMLVSALVVLGAGFALVGSWGLVRLPSLMERLHGPTKATTLGLGALLAASVLWFRLGEGVWSTRELLVALFLFITAPVSANMIAKVHLHRQRAGAADAPPGPAGAPARAQGGADWATYAAPLEGTAGDFTGD